MVNLTGAASVTLTGGQSHGCCIYDIDWSVNVTYAAPVTLTGDIDRFYTIMALNILEVEMTFLGKERHLL